MSRASSSVLVARLNKDIVVDRGIERRGMCGRGWGEGKGLKLTRIIGELRSISEWLDWQKMFVGPVFESDSDVRRKNRR